MPIPSQSGTVDFIQVCRSSSFVIPFSRYSSWPEWRFIPSGRPNHSMAIGNIQSTARWIFSFASPPAAERRFIHISP
jgi:hypothetical protein